MQRFGSSRLRWLRTASERHWVFRPLKQSRPIRIHADRNRREWNLWKWSTRGVLQSRDNLEHLRAVVALLEGKADQLAGLRASGCQTDIICYWVSSGQGGPYLDSSTMRSLATLGLDVAWDMYFGEESDYLEARAVDDPDGA